MRSTLMRRTARLSTSLAPRSRMMSSKVRATPAEAVEDVVDGSSLLVGGFGLSGVPEALLRAVREKGSKNLTVVSSNVGTGERGLGLLFQTKQISKMVGSYVGENDIFEQQFLNGEIEVELVPMGTLAERMRAAGAGIPAFYTRTGSGTLVHHGGAPTRYAADGSRTQIGESEPRESRMFKVPRKPRCADSEYILEHALDGDFAFVKAWKADPEGNLVFRKTARNHNPAIATAGRITIAEVEEIVPMGEIPPDQVHIPGIYVNRVVQAERMGLIERLTLADAPSSFDPKSKPSDAMREKIIKRAAHELFDGAYVNLGIGIPTLVSDYVPAGVNVTLQSENGMLGVGPFPMKGSEDCDLINAGKQTVTEIPGTAYFAADQSFAMIRGGHCDVTILGSMQVAANGDMANYLIPGKMVKGMGGAMDLVASGSRVVVTMEHTAKGGKHKLLSQCTLPLTGQRVVDRIITEMGVFDTKYNGKNELTLIELAEGVSLDEVKAATGAEFAVAPDLKPMMQ